MSGLTVWIPGISESLLSTLFFFGFCCNYERYFKYRYMPKYSMFTDALFTPKGDKRKTTRRLHVVVLWRHVLTQLMPKYSMFTDALFTPKGDNRKTTKEASCTNILADVLQSKPLLQSMNAGHIL